MSIKYEYRCFFSCLSYLFLVSQPYSFFLSGQEDFNGKKKKEEDCFLLSNAANINIKISYGLNSGPEIEKR